MLTHESDVAAPFIVAAPTALGHVAVAVHDGVVLGVAFGHRSARLAENSLRQRLTPCATGSASVPPALRTFSQSDDDLASDILDRLTRYADGEPVDLDDISVATDHLTPFARRVVKACRAIPRGQTRSYGE